MSRTFDRLALLEALDTIGAAALAHNTRVIGIDTADGAMQILARYFPTSAQGMQRSASIPSW